MIALAVVGLVVWALVMLGVVLFVESGAAGSAEQGLRSGRQGQGVDMSDDS